MRQVFKIGFHEMFSLILTTLFKLVITNSETSDIWNTGQPSGNSVEYQLINISDCHLVAGFDLTFQKWFASFPKENKLS